MSDVAARYDQTAAGREYADAMAYYQKLKNNPEYQAQEQPQSAPTQPQDGTMKGIGKGIMGGAASAGKNFLDLIDDLQAKVTDHKMGLGDNEVFNNAVDYWKTDSGAGNAAKQITEFTYGFLPALKAAKVAGVASKAAGLASKVVPKAAGAIGMSAEGAAAGMAAGVSTVSPDTERLGAMLNDHVPMLKDTVLDYLSADPNDSDLEKRLKNGLDNALFGIVGDALIGAVGTGIKAYKASRLAKGANPAEELGAHLSETEAKQAAVKEELNGVVGTAEEAKAAGKDAVDVQISKEAADAVGAKAESIGLQDVKNVAMDSAEVEAQRAAPIVRLDSTKVDDVVNHLLTGDTKAAVENGLDFNYSLMNSGEDVKNTINKVAEAMKGSVSFGPKSMEAVEAAAREEGLSVKQLESLYGGSEGLAEKFLAARYLRDASASKLLEMADNISKLTEGGGAGNFASVGEAILARDTALLEMRAQVVRHAEIQAQVKGTQTEIARALRAMQIPSGKDKAAMEAIEDMINGLGGRDVNVKFATDLAKLKNNPQALEKYLQKGVLAKTWSALEETWMNSILSGPVTHAANIVGNGLRAVGTIAENYGAATANMIRGGKDGKTFQEATQHTWGMLEGLLDTIRVSKGDMGNTWRSFAEDAPIGRELGTGMQGEFRNTSNTTLSHAINSANFNTGNGLINKAIDWAGTAIRLPGRMLQSEDQMFWDLNFRGSLRAGAYRTAKTEGLEGEALATRIAELIDNPTEALRKEAHDAAADGTFTKKLEHYTREELTSGVNVREGFEQMGNWLQSGSATIPGVRFIIPFVRTPSNIALYTFDRLPLISQLSSANRAMWEAGGRQRDQLMAQWAFGGSMLSLGWYLASQGHIQGGGVLDSKASKDATNFQPYSIKIGDQQYSFNRLDPVGQFFALAADTVDLVGHLDTDSTSELAAAIITAQSKYLMDKSYLQGTMDFVNAIHDSISGPIGGSSPALKWLSKMSTGFVPYQGMRNQINKTMIDPETKEVYGYIDSLKAQTPGLSKDLFPKRHMISGEPVVYEGGVGPDMVSPIYSKTEVQEPYAKAIAETNIDLQPPAKFIGKVGLTGKEYDRLMVLMTQEVKMGGKNLKEYLNDLVQSPAWDNATSRQGDYEGTREYMLKKVYSKYKQAATSMLLSEDDKLMEQVKQDKTNKMSSFLGRPIIALEDSGDEPRATKGVKAKKIIPDIQR